MTVMSVAYVNKGRCDGKSAHGRKSTGSEVTRMHAADLDEAGKRRAVNLMPFFRTLNEHSDYTQTRIDVMNRLNRYTPMVEWVRISNKCNNVVITSNCICVLISLLTFSGLRFSRKQSFTIT